MEDSRAGDRATTRLVHLGVLGVAVLGLSAVAIVPHVLGAEGLLVSIPLFRERCNSSLVEHLGGEYLCIARALAAGRGFADPFGEPTGPTAWMPPVYPAVMAALLKVFGDVRPVVICIVALQNLALFFAGWVVLRFSRRSATRRSDETVALVLYIGALCYQFNLAFQFTHDHWLILLLLSALIVSSEWLSRHALGAAAAAAWGALGGLCALSGPVLALVWAVLTADLSFGARQVRPIAVSLVGAMVLAAPWVARNYIVFDRLIPVKSNAFYELYQSNDIEPDGILHWATVATHPYDGENDARKRYRELGEIRFLDEYKHLFLKSLRRDPLGYLAKVGNRLVAALLVYTPYNPNERGIGLWAGYILHPLPLYGLVLMLTCGGVWSRRDRRIAVLAYGSYLLPYVLVAYYERYAFPLLPIQVLFCFWGWQSLRDDLARPTVT